MSLMFAVAYIVGFFCYLFVDVLWNDDCIPAIGFLLALVWPISLLVKLLFFKDKDHLS